MRAQEATQEAQQEVAVRRSPARVHVEARELEVVAWLRQRDEALVDRHVVQRRALQPGIDAARSQQVPARQDWPTGNQLVVARILQPVLRQHLHDQRGGARAQRGHADPLAAQPRDALDPCAGHQRKRQPVHVATDDHLVAARFGIEDDMLGHAIGELRASVAHPLVHLLDALDVVDRQRDALGFEQPGMQADPGRHVEVVARDDGERQAVHGGVPSPGATLAPRRAAAQGGTSRAPRDALVRRSDQGGSTA